MFNLEKKDRILIVKLLRELYDMKTGGKSWSYMDEEQRKEATEISNLLSTLGYNAFTEGLSF